MNYFNLEIQCGAMQMCISPIEDFSFEQKKLQGEDSNVFKSDDLWVKHVVYSAWSSNNQFYMCNYLPIGW